MHHTIYKFKLNLADNVQVLLFQNYVVLFQEFGFIKKIYFKNLKIKSKFKYSNITYRNQTQCSYK